MISTDHIRSSIGRRRRSSIRRESCRCCWDDCWRGGRGGRGSTASRWRCLVHEYLTRKGTVGYGNIYWLIFDTIRYSNWQLRFEPMYIPYVKHKPPFLEFFVLSFFFWLSGEGNPQIRYCIFSTKHERSYSIVSSNTFRRNWLLASIQPVN